jgi:hypothetical protein
MLDEERDQDAYDKTKDTRRQELRERLLLKILVDENAPTVYEVEYHGYGDSGQMEQDSGDKEVDDYLDGLSDEHVHFDWYNNDGGGFTITWDIKADTITINGYQNETVKNDVLDLEL